MGPEISIPFFILVLDYSDLWSDDLVCECLVYQFIGTLNINEIAFDTATSDTVLILPTRIL